jgi:hypothetical protein
LNTKFLIDAIVQQTTVLIAQLSTASGVRAPLSHVADQVFLDLAREIEAQGVSRKVVADMFGLALRTYQKKIQRLTESVTTRDRTLWEAVLEYLSEHGSRSRRELLARFERDDPLIVGSVLNDLMSNGLVYKTGSGESAVFGITQGPDLARTVREQQRESLVPVVWAMIYRAGTTTREPLLEQLGVQDAALDDALATLLASGQVERSGDGAGATYRAHSLVIPLDSEHGWEAALFDHFQAMVRAIGTKLRRGTQRAQHRDMVGGATLGFDIRPGHPYHDEVLGLLRRVRADVNELWERVQAHNEKDPLPDEERTEVLFYFGQCVTPPDEE